MSDALKVLVVDDDDMIRSVVRIALQKVNGWVVIEATNGAEGLVAANVEAPDAILLDYQMPKMDGAETLSRLKADAVTAAIPVIFLTAKAGRKARNEYVTMGAVGTIEKPFDPLVLGAEISEMLARASAV